MDIKKILVTGASRGIGYALVMKFAEMGHEVLAVSREGGQLNELTSSSHPTINVLHADITTRAGIDMIESFVGGHWGNVDVLLHNAGALLNKPFKETTTEDFLSIYEVNVFAVAALTRQLDPYLKEGAHVVTISSMGGIQGSMKFAGLAAYSSSKGAVITLMELLAEEYKERKVSFNSLALGAVQTEMLKEAFPDFEASVSAEEMAGYIADFALQGNKVFNGKVLQVSNSTP